MLLKFKAMMNKPAVCTSFHVSISCFCCCWKHSLSVQFLDHAAVPFVDSSEMSTVFQRGSIIFQSDLLCL